MLRDGRELVPTAKAFQLMTLLRGLDVEDLTKPELTGDWEYRLLEMEHGRLSRDAFMAEIAAAMAAAHRAQGQGVRPRHDPGRLRDAARRRAPTAAAWSRRTTAASPARGLRSFSITKIPGGRSFEIAEAEAFLRDKKIGPLEGFRSKAGWPFTAELRAGVRRRDRQLEARVRLRRGRAPCAGGRRAGRLLGAQSLARPVPQVQGPRLRARHQLRLRARRRRRTSPATSRAARSSCSSRWRTRRCTSC